MKMDKPPDINETKKVITLGHFAVNMMGKSSVNWYYNRLKKYEPGFPQRKYLPGSRHPVLDYEECVAYMDSATTTPPWKPKRRSGST